MLQRPVEPRQYMSKEFTELLESYDIRLSVGRT
ncbi:integrase [Propionibacterium freudenreichii]|nr:integrase [Propionibacterium freudenreichii]MCT2994145.1 integrase [Propionibacterium freudenreichii]